LTKFKENDIINVAAPSYRAIRRERRAVRNGIYIFRFRCGGNNIRHHYILFLQVVILKSNKLVYWILGMAPLRQRPRLASRGTCYPFLKWITVLDGKTGGK
ncbi:MAG: hypothetical protein LBC86_01450, partial [Oscillospiraceae bacterium]|nr:hypothetical protein [Oscillospiraceae bacterium]